ncbi:unnamed protein product [Cuscuta europaea]|uniref:Uncharacterized protein n=1 Tax=Cuscuta europaea TaxID=41803 RepID=A0A9P0ZLQ1_CUSEU|nr:unnamed protein product [Cuscuta europaea]
MKQRRTQGEGSSGATRPFFLLPFSSFLFSREIIQLLHESFVHECMRATEEMYSVLRSREKICVCILLGRLTKAAIISRFRAIVANS